MARPRSTIQPQTAAQRQAKCRAIKRGTWHSQPGILLNYPPGTINPNAALRLMEKQTPALPAPEKSQSALPAPRITAIQKTVSKDTKQLALPGVEGVDHQLHLILPPGVAARLRSLLEKHDAGKSLTTDERAEAQGLLDIAEFFVVQRLRHRLAA